MKTECIRARVRFRHTYGVLTNGDVVEEPLRRRVGRMPGQPIPQLSAALTYARRARSKPRRK